MRNKNSKIAILKEQLPKYCKQIGIQSNRIPTMVFTPKEFDELTPIPGGHRTKRNSCLGKSYTVTNTILVNLEYSEKYIHRPIYSERPPHRLIRWERRIWNLHEAIRTLVHELVHIKWIKKAHGYYFEKRIDEILKGAVFAESVPVPLPIPIAEKRLEPEREPALPRQFELIRLQL